MIPVGRSSPFSFGFLQAKDKLVEFGDYPDFWQEEERVAPRSKAMFHQCYFAVNAPKHLFASCSFFVLDIYEYDPSGKKCPSLKFRKQLGKYEYDFSTQEKHSGARLGRQSGETAENGQAGDVSGCGRKDPDGVLRYSRSRSQALYL